MTLNNQPQGIEDLPPSNIDTYARRRVTGYQPPQPNVIDTGTTQLESPTVKDIVAEREDNPFLRLAVVGGVMGVICLFLWAIFAILAPKAPPELVEAPQVETVDEPEPDYRAKLALRDQLHSLEKKQSEPEPEPISPTELPPVKTVPTPVPQPISQPVARPIPKPPAPRPIPRLAPRPAPRAVSRPAPRPVPAVPQEQWLALANFGTGVSSRSIPAKSKSPALRSRIEPNTTNQAPAPALLVNKTVSQGELGILNRQTQDSFPQPVPKIVLGRGITKGKIELPLVWNSSLSPEQQQSNQIAVVLEEPIYDIAGELVFERDSVAIVQVDSIDDSNGLVTAHVSQIDDTTFQPGELILRNKKKSALVAKASLRSDFGDELLVGGVNTLSSFGQQLLIPETSSTFSNGNTIVESQSRNSVGRDLAGSALDGFGSSLSNELSRRNTRNLIGDGGTIFTLSQGETVYLTNIQPIQINP